MSSDDSDGDFPGGPTDIEFWGLEVPAGETVVASTSRNPGVTEIVHVSNVALGEKPGKGPVLVWAVQLNEEGKAKQQVALGTLEAGRTDQFAADFGFSTVPVAFKHSGKGSVWLSGYLTRSFAEGAWASDEDEDYEGSEEEDSSEEDEDEEAPDAIPLANGPPKSKQQQPQQPGRGQRGEPDGSSDEGEEDEEGDSSEGEGEEDEDEEGDRYDRLLGAKSFGSSEDEGQQGEASEGDPLDLNSDDLVAGVEYEAMDADEDDGLDEGEEEGEDDEGESSEEEEEEEDEEEAPAAAASKRPAKRPAPTPLTPQPGAASKKQKGEAGKPAPGSAPAKAPAAKAGSGSVEQQFVASLVAELKASGPLTLSALASKVKKPEGVPCKYKAFLTQHAGTFSLEGETVSLAK